MKYAIIIFALFLSACAPSPQYYEDDYKLYAVEPEIINQKQKAYQLKIPNLNDTDIRYQERFANYDLSLTQPGKELIVLSWKYAMDADPYTNDFKFYVYKVADGGKKYIGTVDANEHYEKGVIIDWKPITRKIDNFIRKHEGKLNPVKVAKISKSDSNRISGTYTVTVIGSFGEIKTAKFPYSNREKYVDGCANVLAARISISRNPYGIDFMKCEDSNGSDLLLNAEEIIFLWLVSRKY